MDDFSIVLIVITFDVMFAFLFHFMMTKYEVGPLWIIISFTSLLNFHLQAIKYSNN